MTDDDLLSSFAFNLNLRPCAVVVFSRQMDAVIASQVQLDHFFGRWNTDAAPGPNDLVGRCSSKPVVIRVECA